MMRRAPTDKPHIRMRRGCFDVLVKPTKHVFRDRDGALTTVTTEPRQALFVPKWGGGLPRQSIADWLGSGDAGTWGGRNNG